MKTDQWQNSCGKFLPSQNKKFTMEAKQIEIKIQLTYTYTHIMHTKE